MKTTLKIIAAVILLFILAIIPCSLLCEKQTAIQNHAVAPASETKHGADTARADLPEFKAAHHSQGNSGSSAEAAPPNPDNKKAQDVKSEHTEIILRGVKLGDWIAICTLFTSVLLGTLALIFTGWGIRQNRISNQKQNRAYIGIESLKSEKKFIEEGSTEPLERPNQKRCIYT